MTEHVIIAANWALWGKHPGSNDDYSVLSCSAGQFSKADFAAILSRFAPGTPSVHRAGPGKLPWVTLSWVGIDANLHLGIAVQDAANQVDGAGRPITRTSYFCVPFEAMARKAISYASLFEQVQALELPATDGEPVPLRLGSLDTEELALSLEDFGEDTVCTTASMLLGGPVSIIQADTSRLPERLRFLDAVAAMLPYGYRAKYTAATWSDSGIRHRIRLAFAERPRENACQVIWRQPADMSAGSPAAQRYLAQLRRVRGRNPDSGRPTSRTDVIARLAGHIVPHKFEDSQYAITCVREIDLPFAVLADVRVGQADLAEIRQVFDQLRIKELVPDGRRTMLAGLVSFGDQADVARLQMWWEPIVQDQPDTVLPALTTTARRLLWAPSPSQSVHFYLQLAAMSGVADGLLASLITPPSAAAVPAAALAHAAQLLVDWIFASGLPGRRQRIAEQLATDFRQTLATLPANPAVACEMAAQLAISGPDARSAVEWLAARLPALLAPFQAIVAAHPRQVDARAIDQLYSAGWDCVRTLLAADSSLARLDSVLPGLTGWLINHGRLDPPERTFWRDQLLELRPSTIADQASADLALLVLGDYPRWLLSAAQQSDWPVYRDRFVGQSSKLGLRLGTTDGDRLSETLCRFLDRPDWPISAEQAIAVADLTQRLTEGHRKSILLGLVASVLWNDPAARQQASTDRWLARIDRGLIQRGVQYSLRRLQPGVRLDRLAVLCERGFDVGLHPDDAGKAFAESAALAMRSGGAEILDALRVNYGLESARDSGGSLLRRMTVITGPVGEPDSAGEQQAPGGLIAWIGRALGRSDAGQGQGAPVSAELTKEQREQLKRWQDWIDVFTKAARKARQRRLADGPDQAVGQQWQVTR